MTVTVVANPKGGVGKSTIATNLAGYLARQGRAVALGDVDRQESARLWLSLRPAALPVVQLWEATHDDVVKLPKRAEIGVLDTPAGLSGKRLDAVMKRADRVLVPLQPGLFDIYATRDFVAELLAHRRHEGVEVALVANRVREHTLSADQLRQFRAQLGQPVLTELRDTQNYVQLAAHGLSLWDVAAGRVTRDLAQWAPVVAWMDNAAAA
jgi:chromosome partitioning protein